MRARSGLLLITIVASTSKDAGKVHAAPSTTTMSGTGPGNAMPVMNVEKMIATIAVTTIVREGAEHQKWNPHFTPNSFVVFNGS